MSYDYFNSMSSSEKQRYLDVMAHDESVNFPSVNPQWLPDRKPKCNCKCKKVKDKLIIFKYIALV